MPDRIAVEPAATLRLGLSSGVLYPHTPTEAVPAIAAAWGVGDVELMLQTLGEYDPSFLRGIAAGARERGVRVNSLHTFQEFHRLFTPYSRRTAEGLALFDQVIATAAEIGARVLVWHGPLRAAAPSPDRWGDFLAMTERVAARCAAAGVTLALENVSWCALATVRDVLAFAARIPELGPPGSVGFTFDPFQAHEAGANPFMILAAMEGALVDVHLSDARAGDASARHLAPGAGDLPWPALLRAIHGTGYRGPMMVESALDTGGDGWRAVRSALDPLLAPLGADDADAPLPPGVLEGIALFNEGKYYEAHEALEHEWHAERRPVRRLYQGILQIGVGLHHARGGNHRGAILLLTDGIEKTSRFLPACRGIDTAALVAAAQRCLEEVERLGPERLGEFDWSLAPRIELPAPSSHER